jgi:superfamily II DNA/RNA helicase
MPPSEKIKYEDGCTFEEIKEIAPKTVKLLTERGFTKLMPVQANTFETIYSGKNMVARDLTGSGKTLGFCLPLVERFRAAGYFEGSEKRYLRAIILAPTRELAV